MRWPRFKSFELAENKHLGIQMPLNLSKWRHHSACWYLLVVLAMLISHPALCFTVGLFALVEHNIYLRVICGRQAGGSFSQTDFLVLECAYSITYKKLSTIILLEELAMGRLSWETLSISLKAESLLSFVPESVLS